VDVKHDLVVAGVRVGDADSTSADLLTAKVRTATLLLRGTANEACVGIDVVANQWQVATISLWGRWCGDVTRSSSDDLVIDGVALASTLLAAKQTTQLAAVVGGHACLTIQINTNIYSAELTELEAPAGTATPSQLVLASPSPVPTAEPTAVPAPTLSSTSPAPSPTAQALVSQPTASADDRGGTSAMLLIGIVVLAGGAAAAYLLNRRRRDGGPAVDVSPVAAAGSTPAVASGQAMMSINLTPREREVVDMLLEGSSNKEIATRLFISESTAGVHVSNVMTKLGAHSRGEAAAIAHRLNLRGQGPLAN
jgi:DNA-binding CsgD family transcriptional regulator